MPIGIDHTLFPGSRGHAVLEYGDEELVTAQFVFPSIPRAGRYRIVFRYSLSGSSRRPMVMVMQGGTSVSGRVLFYVSCVPPCHEAVATSQDVNQVAVFDLVEDSLSVQISLTGINVLIDSIIAIPEEFYAAAVPEREQFSEECDVTMAMFR